MRLHTKLVMLAVAGCAVVATTACSSPSKSTATPPIAAPSASSGVGAPAEESASPEPTATTSPAASPSPPSRKPATGQAGQSSEPDWKRIAFRALACKPSYLPAKAEIHQVDHADLTGDGRRDAIVVASCPTNPSTNAVHVFVYDGDSTKKPLLTVGKDSYLRTADITTSGRKLTVDSEAISDDAPLCCPDLRVSQTWTWNGSTFKTAGPKQEKIG